MRYTSITHRHRHTTNFLGDFQGCISDVIAQYKTDCLEIGASWGILLEEETGAEVFRYQRDDTLTNPIGNEAMQKPTIQLDRIVVVKTANIDFIVVYPTGMPSACYPYSSPLRMEFQAAAGTGTEYVRERFNIEPETLNIEHITANE